MRDEGLIFRQMEGADLDRVSEIERRASSFPWSRGKIEDSLSVGSECWLACLAGGSKENEEEGRDPRGEPAAYAILSTVLDEASLLNLSVDPDHQGKGVGRALLGFLLERARRQGINKVFLEVRASNSRAIALYESAGFRALGRRAAYYPGGRVREDALLYCLESGPSSSLP